MSSLGVRRATETTRRVEDVAMTLAVVLARPRRNGRRVEAVVLGALRDGMLLRVVRGPADALRGGAGHTPLPRATTGTRSLAGLGSVRALLD